MPQSQNVMCKQKKNRNMKELIIILLITISISSFGQESKINILFNKELITFIDNNENVNFSISFQGDTLIPSEIENVYMIDTSLFQIVKFPIPKNRYNDKYKSKKEIKLLDYFHDYEFNYLKNEIFQKNIRAEKEYFNNSFGKQFLLWYYEIPNESNEISNSYQENDSTTVQDLIVQHQLYLTFVSNSYVVMINSSVFDNELLDKKIKTLKEIANSVRIYAGSININALNNQIDHKLEKIPFTIIDSISGLNITIPFWLNIIESDKYDIVSTFPDINNISNSLVLDLFNQASFGSFTEFKDKMLKNKDVKKYESAKCENEKLQCYKTIYQASNGIFTCQYIFFRNKETYGLINFTATKNTYDKNIDKLNEFINGIEIE